MPLRTDGIERAQLSSMASCLACCFQTQFISMLRKASQCNAMGVGERASKQVHATLFGPIPLASLLSSLCD